MTRPSSWSGISAAFRERQRLRCFRRDGWRCTKCGRDGVKLEAHHVRPVAAGGGHGLENLASTCTTCHVAEHRRPATEWESFARE